MAITPTPTGSNTQTLSALIKTQYAPDKLAMQLLQDAPAIALIEKEIVPWVGGQIVVPTVYGNPQTASATILTSLNKAQVASSSTAAFNVTQVQNYAAATISRQLMKASKSDVGAFIKGFDLEVKGAMRALKRLQSVNFYRAGWGDCGVVGALSGSTMTLASLGDANNFEVNMDVQFAATQASSNLRASGATLTVTGVNRTTGVVTFSAAVSTVAGLAVGDYVFFNGCRMDSTTPSRLLPAGIGAWCPTLDPVSGALFFGVDRSVDNRLGGFRYNGSSLSIEEALMEGANLAAAQGASPDYAFVSYRDFTNLAKSQQGRNNYYNLNVKVSDNDNAPSIGFSSIKLRGPSGEIIVVPDTACPQGTAFITQLDSWKFASQDEFISIIDDDGMTILRQSGADGFEARMVLCGNFYTNAPGYTVAVQLPVTA
jgi:hypothetical protein